MPDAEWMKSVLGQAPVAEEDLPPVEGEEPDESGEEPDDEEQPEAEDEDPDADAEDEEGGEEDLPPDDDAEADEEPEASHEEGEFYLGRYRTREDAEQGLREKDATTNEALRRAAEIERELAYYRGLAEGRVHTGGDVDFEEWAEGHLDRDPERGFIEAREIERETGDFSYADEYLRAWHERDPLRATRAATHLDLERAMRSAAAEREQQEQEPGVDQVLNDTWVTLAEQYADMREEPVVKGMAEILHSDEELRGGALSGDPRTVRMAFIAARERYRLQTARPGNGTPRRARTKDVEKVEEEKRAATVSTGDGAPAKRPSTPELTPEEEVLLAGAQKMGLKLRET